MVAMKRSKDYEHHDHLRFKRANSKQRNPHNEEEKYIPRKRRNSGKRFHRKRTLKEELWEDLTGRQS